MTALARSAVSFAVGATVLTACTTAGPAEVNGTGSIETVDLIELATNIESYRGRTIRTCGASFERGRPDDDWYLAQPAGRHAARIIVLPCGESRPIIDRRNCITGRIARRDGSLQPLVEGEERWVSSSTMSFTWLLHPQCPARRR